MILQINNEKQSSEMTDSTMNDTEKKSCENGCKNIGKIWTRNCPKCGMELIYKSRRGYWWSNKYNLICRGCTRKMKGLTYPSRKGCYLTDEHKNKIGNAIAIRHKIYGHPMEGRHHTEESRLQIQVHSSGKNNGMYGKHHTYKSRKQISIKRMGMDGPKISREGLRSLRIKRIAEISKAKFDGGQVMPSYNHEACNFFNRLNEKLKWNGQYATNGHEYYIKELGYFVDYYEPTLNLIIEWDEDTHYDVDGNLKIKDEMREKEIKSYLNCKFFRIKESKFHEENVIKDINEYIKITN
jgi:predicted RNA-binding Zn-ribbon protein involved in translation (DUF1610 family)